MSPPRQLSLRFPHDLPDFSQMTLTLSNRGAVTSARKVEFWPYHVFCIIGPPRSGLTSIARAWAAERGGLYLDQDADLSAEALPDERLHDIALDRADRLTHDEGLLNLIAAVRRAKGRILLTAHTAPSQWQNRSADLSSRLKSAPLAEIAPPDDELMRARLNVAAKQAFIALPKPVEDYLVTRLGLSYAALETMIEDLSASMVGRELTVPLAREILDGRQTSD